MECVGSTPWRLVGIHASLDMPSSGRRDRRGDGALGEQLLTEGVLRCAGLLTTITRKNTVNADGGTGTLLGTHGDSLLCCANRTGVGLDAGSFYSSHTISQQPQSLPVHNPEPSFHSLSLFVGFQLVA